MKMTYFGVNDERNTVMCSDGHGSDRDGFEFSEDQYYTKSCMANSMKSSVNYTNEAEDRADITMHFMKDMYTADTDQDLIYHPT